MTACQHTYGQSCRLAPEPASPSTRVDAPPSIRALFFYQSALSIDDPLSPLPYPSATASSTALKYPLRPFAVRDNVALEEVWQGLNAGYLGSRRLNGMKY